MTTMELLLTAAPKMFEPGIHECCFVRWMLRLRDIWDLPAGLSEEDNQYLIDETISDVARLNKFLDAEDDFTPEYDTYRRVLILCSGVLAGVIKAPVPVSVWEFEIGDLPRGTYLSPAGVARWNKEDRGRRQMENHILEVRAKEQRE